MLEGKEKAPCTAATVQSAKGKMLNTKNNPFVQNCQVAQYPAAGLQGVIDAMRTNSQMAFRVAGTCLAGAGVDDKDMVLVDFDRRPRPALYPAFDGERRQDFCLCWGMFPTADRSNRRPALLLKGYIGSFCGRQLVGTFWEDRPNCAFSPDAILGVVVAVYDCEGRLKWENSPAVYPLTLPKGDTIHSEQVGEDSPAQ